MVLRSTMFLPALIRALRYEAFHLSSGEWYEGMLAELMNIPRFRHYWETVEREPEVIGAARALVPVLLAVPGAGLLQFRLSSEPFSRDPRFRVIYYFPADIPTMRRCAAWTAEGCGE